VTSILGILKDKTSFRKPIRSGGSALIQLSRTDTKITALAEERSSGKKYAGGFATSLADILISTDSSLDDLDFIAVSSCCEPLGEVLHGLPDLGPAQLVPVGHHESHATLAFLGSGYDEALVVVSDGGGDVLDQYEECDYRWWLHPREQLTFWHGSRHSGLTLLDRDFGGPLETGFGEFYRSVSYFLGWHGSRHASKVMALAAYGHRSHHWPEVFQFGADGHLRSTLLNNPDDPIGMIATMGSDFGLDLGEPRRPHAEILEVHRNLATYTQAELERAMVVRLKALLAQTGLRRICLSGGVALNVVANGALQKKLRVPIYVTPAPADDGQPLGNALSVWWRNMPEFGALRKFRITRSSDAQLGPPRALTSATVSGALVKHGMADCAVFEYSSSALTVAKVLAAGSLVCVFQDRSEYGPRALGSRSILGDPRLKDGRARFNQVKGRDWFMPFAPSVAADIGLAWFSAAPIDSPFMSFANDINPEHLERIRAVSANDGTGRVQTVSPDDKFIADVVREFHTQTEVPMVLNTSFNKGGHPIVESVDDAFASFADMPINIMAFGRFLIVKSLSPDLISADVMPSQFPIDAVIVNDGQKEVLELSKLTSRECIRKVQERTGLIVFVRSELPLYRDFLDRLRRGKKRSTIRYRKGAVEIPSFNQLPLYETPDYGVGDRSKPTALVEITNIRYQIFGELTERDAVTDGFSSLAEMRRELTEIYKDLRDDEWVTIYSIELKEDYLAGAGAQPDASLAREPRRARAHAASMMSRQARRRRIARGG
jgi:carbamoyltransferase